MTNRKSGHAVPGDIGTPPWTNEGLIEALGLFSDVYASRPIPDNTGGMMFNHCFAVWSILRAVRPPLVVESGVLGGQGTWLIEQASPESEIVSLDVNFQRLKYKSSKAEYIEKDLMSVDWSGRSLQDALFIFDDHNNAYRRIQEISWLGARRAIFEDNFPVGEGDAYSLRHMHAGTGRERLQMSRHSRRLIKELRNKIFEYSLKSRHIKYSQTALVAPNSVDWANLRRRLEVFAEFPPVWLPEIHDGWKRAFEGACETKKPLLASPPERFDGDYGFIAYLELQSS